jgi:hypothetical protein
MAFNLTAEERETLIVWSDADERLSINTSQRKVINQLLKNPSFEETDRVTEDKRVILLSGFLPLNGLTIRKGKGTTSAPKRSLPANAARCSAKKANGEPCQALANKATGTCARHA